MQGQRVVDLNADVGEECGNDAGLLGIVTSANIACGAHAGNATVMRRTVELAQHHGVSIGAHVSYPDREHFGRRELNLPAAEISMAVRQQLEALAAVARAAGTTVRYVKPHGALYNRMARDATVADAVLMTMRDLDPALSLLTLPDCVAMRRAMLLGVTSVAEAFADRAYVDDGNLIPRDQPGAVLGDAAEVSRRMLKYVQEGVLASISGKLLKFTARSVCVHGDTPDAVNMARQLRTVFAYAGIELRAFA